MAGSLLCPLENAHWVVDDKGPAGRSGSGQRRTERFGARLRSGMDHICAAVQLSPAQPGSAPGGVLAYLGLLPTPPPPPPAGKEGSGSAGGKGGLRVCWQGLEFL